MRNQKKIINSIKKNISIFINNTYAFNTLLNNSCIIVGKFLLNHINHIYKYNIYNNNKDVIDIYCDLYQYNRLKIFLINNNFRSIKMIVGSNKRTYIKILNYNSLTFNIQITNYPIKYIDNNIKLNIEKVYYNGALLVMPYIKNILLKYEEVFINDLEYITSPEILLYLSYGYKFRFTNIKNYDIIIMSNYFKKNKRKQIKNIVSYILYKCHIYI